MSDLLFLFVWIRLLCLGSMNNSFTCLAKSKPVKQDYTSRYEISQILSTGHSFVFDQTRKYAVICMYWNYSIKTIQTGDQYFSDTSLYGGKYLIGLPPSE